MENKAEEPIALYGQSLTFEKVWEMFQETDRQFKETDRKIKETNDYFTFQWGRLVGSLVKGDLVKHLRAKGIQVESVAGYREGSRNGENFEFDLIAVNTAEIVIVEVKTTLRPDDV